MSLAFAYKITNKNDNLQIKHVMREYADKSTHFFVIHLIYL